MADTFISDAGEQPADDPRPVSRGSKLQTAFLGIDSLYLVMEYPHSDVFDYWSKPVGDFSSPRLNDGLPFAGMVIRRGGLGYRLSVWDGDARLYLTERVDDKLLNSPYEGQGMGLMLQLGPKWLRQYGDVVSPTSLLESILTQFALFGVDRPDRYRLRINRLDIALDVLGLDVGSFSVDQWRKQWVGYATQKDFHDSAQTGRLEGLSIGSSEGAVRFKVYDKVAESLHRGTFRFWRSVWGIEEELPIFSVARFEWSIKCYQAHFANMRFLSDFSFEGFLDLLNYVSLKWGRLCVPQADDSNQSRWPLSPLWADLRQLIDEWSFSYPAQARREYDYSQDIKDSYLRSLAGWLAGLEVRVGLELDRDAPVTLRESLMFLEGQGYSLSDIQRKAADKWQVASKLAGKRGNHGE